MNGIITGQYFQARLTALAEHSRTGVWTEEGITAELNDLRDELVKAANMTMESATKEALEEFGSDRKIQAIKKVRELTGCGLKEAKDAVEQALPGFIVGQIEKLYVQLRQANERVSWNQTRFPDQTLMNADQEEESFPIRPFNGHGVPPRSAL